MTVEYSALNGTPVSPSLRLRELCGTVDKINIKTKQYKEGHGMLSYGHGMDIPPINLHNFSSLHRTEPVSKYSVIDKREAIGHHLGKEVNGSGELLENRDFSSVM